MTDAFTSGLLPHQDLALTGPFPDDPSVAETMNLWLYDGERDIGLNIHPHIKNGEMMAMVTVFLPDGAILRQRMDPVAQFSDPTHPHSQRVSYQCIEPFRRWRYEIKSLPVFKTSDDQQRSGVVEDETSTTEVSLDITGHCVAPAWRNGLLTTEAKQMMAGPAGLWVAGRITSGFHDEAFRYDQLMSARGTIEVEGQTLDFNGVGIRSHVRGARNLEGMAGTCWMSGLFPSGKGFGVLCQKSTEGIYVYSEAYVYVDSEIVPTRILQAPWNGHKTLNEKDFTLQLACDEFGLINIRGEDRRAFYWSMPSWGAARTTPPQYGRAPEAGVLMKQALTMYQWDEEIGFGMNERSG